MFFITRKVVYITSTQLLFELLNYLPFYWFLRLLFLDFVLHNKFFRFI